MNVRPSLAADPPSGPTGRSASAAWMRALERTAHLGDDPTRTLPVVVDELALRFGDREALRGETESLSFAALAERSRRYSRWALAHGVAVGDTVCLLMPNRPEYLACWLGITRIGGVVALLNTQLDGPALAHGIRVAHPTHVIVDARLFDRFAGAASHLPDGPAVWVHGAIADGADVRRLDAELDRLSGAELAAHERRPVGLDARALCIYTSGTTGLPKAAIVSHRRALTWSQWFAGLIDTTPDDRMYLCLPMYHSVGGVVAIGSVLVAGGCVVIRERFSASRFWDDVVREDCTLFQYIGELCRYLLNAPASPAETRHRLRLCCGNGLRADVWSAFQERFRIPKILEFYAATEGNFSLYNVEGKPGAIGRIPAFLAHRFPAAVVRFDVETGQPARDAQGRCIRCARDEAGEAIGRIAASGAAASGRFEGYTSAADTEKKILRDVFEPGDAWARTGDLMRIDPKGFWHFVDRIGDTFRWKGENVSTAEVAEAVASCPGVLDASVYGVEVAGTDGRAGMAALVTDGSFQPATLHDWLAGRLPAYARPLFLRIRDALDLTETFKQKKHDLVREGFDPARTADTLYVDDPRQQAYVPLDAPLFGRIQAGELRL